MKCARCLARDVDERYRDAVVVHEQLRLISREAVVAAPGEKSGDRSPSAALRAGAAVQIGIALLVIAVLTGGGWALIRSNRQREAVGKIEAAEKLLKERKLAEAYEAAMEASAILPNDTRVRDVISRTADRLTIESDPPGAAVYLQRFKGPPQRARMGVTPLTIPQFARADYLLTLEKAGYAPGICTISSLPLVNRGELFLIETPTIRVKLAEASNLSPHTPPPDIGMSGHLSVCVRIAPSIRLSVPTG